MNPIKKAYCRTFQTAFKIALPILPYRKPKMLSGIPQIPSVLGENGCSRVLVITDKNLMKYGVVTPLEKALQDNGVFYLIYDGVVANPTTANVEEALALYHENGCDSIIGFGGGCVNDCIIHLATTEMGFGGFGESGMGSYHGKTGFDTFSHYKSIVDKKTWIDLPMRYQPYKKLYGKMIRMFMK